MINLLWFALLATASLSIATNPGVKVRVTKNGINYANVKVQQGITKQLQSITIPDQSGQSGHISYTLSGVVVTGVTPPVSAISLVPGQTGVSLSLTNLGISIFSHWRVKYRKAWVKISDSGTVDVSVSSITLTETAAFGIDQTGRPSIASAGCSASVGGVSVKFHGGQAFILNLFRGTVADRVKHILQSKICQVVVGYVNGDAEKALSTLPVTVDLAKKFLVDYRLVQPPVITADYLELLDKGEIFWEASPSESPFAPMPIPAWTDNSRMVYFWLTAYTPNTFLYQAHTHGYLHYNVTKDELPAADVGYLNTTCKLKCIGTIIPEIAQKLPNSSLDLYVKTSAVPQAIITSQGISVNVSALVDMWAHTPDGRYVYVLTVALNTMLAVNVGVQNEKVTGAIVGHNIQASLVNSTIGPVDVKPLNIALGGVMDFVIIPRLNAIGAKGVQLPIVDGVQFLNTQIILQERSIIIATDLHYNSGDKRLPSDSSSPGQLSDSRATGQLSDSSSPGQLSESSPDDISDCNGCERVRHVIRMSQG